jgi:hypothetical protein
MFIVTLHKGAQRGIRGQVVLVPAKVEETVKSLPRQTSDSQVIALNLKRRLTDNSPTSKQYIRPNVVNAAFEYLKQHNPHYKDIDENNNWVAKSKTINPELSQAAFQHDESTTESGEEIEANDSDVVVDSEDEVDCDNPSKFVEELKLQRSVNAATCLYPEDGPNLRTNEVLNVAPAQNQIPTHFFYEKNGAAKAFPTLFPHGKFAFIENRLKKITAKKYINARLLLKDTSFAESTEYVFQCLHWAEALDIKNSVTMALKKSQKKASPLHNYKTQTMLYPY